MERKRHPPQDSLRKKPFTRQKVDRWLILLSPDKGSESADGGDKTIPSDNVDIKFYINICALTTDCILVKEVTYLCYTFHKNPRSDSQKSPSGEVEEDMGGWRNTTGDSICQNEHLLPPLPLPSLPPPLIVLKRQLTC